MTQPRIIVAGRIPDAGLDVLRPHGNVWGWKHDEPIEINELYERIAGADAVLTLLTTKIDRSFLEAAGPQLKVVSNVAVGYNNIDVAECRAHGVIATNTPGVLTDATADIAMALILMSTRRLGEGERIVRSGKPWQWGMFMLLGSAIQGRRHQTVEKLAVVGSEQEFEIPRMDGPEVRLPNICGRFQRFLIDMLLALPDRILGMLE